MIGGTDGVGWELLLWWGCYIMFCCGASVGCNGGAQVHEDDTRRLGIVMGKYIY